MDVSFDTLSCGIYGCAALTYKNGMMSRPSSSCSPPDASALPAPFPTQKRGHAELQPDDGNPPPRTLLDQIRKTKTVRIDKEACYENTMWKLMNAQRRMGPGLDSHYPTGTVMAPSCADGGLHLGDIPMMLSEDCSTAPPTASNSPAESQRSVRSNGFAFGV